MKTMALVFTLLLLGGLADQSRAAECYEGTWELETQTDHRILEIKADGCLKLTVTPKDNNGKAVLYNTCYKVKDKKKEVFVFEIDDQGKISSAEVVCSDKQVQLKWGKVSSHTYRPVKK